MANYLGETLFRLRSTKGLSQQQLANKLHMSRSSIANWEAGRRTPDASMVLKIAKVLDVDVSVLLEATGEPSEVPNVVLVDDNPLVLEGSIPVLREALPGASVVGISSPCEALAYFEETPVTLAFLDIELGQTNGLELCRQLLNIRPHANIVFLTAYPEYSLDAWKTDACGFLLKPLEVDDIRRQIPKLRNPVRALL